MKHIFVVHSNITYLSALGVICHDKLNLKDVLIVSSKYFRALPVFVHFIDIKPEFRKLLSNPYGMLRPIKYVDNIIKKLTNNEPYKLYVGGLFDLQRTLLSNPKNQGLNFIEEGFGAYIERIPLRYSLTPASGKLTLRNESIKEFIYDILRIMRGYNSKMQALPLMYPAYFNTIGVDFYGFNIGAFPGVVCPKIMDMNEVVEKFQFEDTEYDFDNSDIWIGTEIDRSIITLDNYIIAIKKGCIDKIAKNKRTKEIFLKFHYMECDDSRTATQKIFENNGFNTTIIEDTTIMEIAFCKSQNITVWGVDSTLLLYTSKQGHKTNSILNFMKGYPIGTSEIYWENINLIE